MKQFLWSVAAWMIMALAYLLLPNTLEGTFAALGMFGRGAWAVLEAGLHVVAVWFAIGTFGAAVFLASGLCHRRSAS
jgi:hypothetical protein